MKADLHNHSSYSDGIYSVLDLIKLASINKIDCIALTDHDSVFGIEEAIKFGKKYNVMVLAGIELSTYYNDESVHIIGLFKNNIIPKEIYDFSLNHKKKRKERAINMLKKIEEIYKVNVNYELLSNMDVITRGNMFQILLESNPNIDPKKATFYVSHDSKAYIEAAKFNTLEGVDFLRKNNCLTIYAHPTLNKKQTVLDVINLGVDGIEYKYPKNKKDEDIYFKDLALKHNLLLSAGSDFHGDINHANIGTSYLEEDEFLIIKERLEYYDN